MILPQVVVLYLLPGCGVAFALLASSSGTGKWERVGVALSAIVFWPIYLPGLLAARPGERRQPRRSVRKLDALDQTIDRVERDLSSALAGLEGWVTAGVSLDERRIQELHRAWTGLAERIREMDRILSEADQPPTADLLADPSQQPSSSSSERLRHSLESRRQNLDRLRLVRRRAYEDLMGTLAWVRELISMIHLARFTGAPAARLQELVGQIASAVEALGEVVLNDIPEDERSCVPSDSLPISTASEVISTSSACPREMSPTPGP
jgi:hypothetical protein